MHDFISFVLAFVLTSLPAQRIETERADRGLVKQVETAMDHLTVIELAESIVTAAAGSPSFKIERQGNKVLIQPLEEGASTNLFIWTASNRFSYELVPAVSIRTMHFAIDQEQPMQAQTPTGEEDKSPSTIAADRILQLGTPVRILGAHTESGKVGIRITDVFENKDELTIRYTVENRSRQPYAMHQPQVFILQSPKSPVSLFALRNTQVDSSLAKSIRSSIEHPISIFESKTLAELVRSGELKPGLFSLHSLPPDSGPAVLRVVFPAGPSSGPISITLVL